MVCTPPTSKCISNGLAKGTSWLYPTRQRSFSTDWLYDQPNAPNPREPLATHSTPTQTLTRLFSKFVGKGVDLKGATFNNPSSLATCSDFFQRVCWDYPKSITRIYYLRQRLLLGFFFGDIMSLGTGGEIGLHEVSLKAVFFLQSCEKTIRSQDGSLRPKISKI